MNSGLNPDDEPGSPRAAVMDALRRMFVEDGVQEDRLIEEAGKSSSFGQGSLQDALDDLKRRGEVYVVEDRVKPTSNPG